MEEELHYATVTFKPNAASINADVKPVAVIYEELKAEQQSPTVTPEVVKDSEKIYDELKAEEKPQIHIYNGLTATSAENRRKASVCPYVVLVAAGLGFVCVGLLSAVIALSLHMNRLSSECLSETESLTEDIEVLRKELSRLQTLNEDLSANREELNWTLSVIMKYNQFSVSDHCPQQVCKPCLNGWLLFQSSCYFFPQSGWKWWKESREFCRERNADLVTIQSQEEQEFISNHTVQYHSEFYGYWIGFRKTDGVWSWVDGSEPNGSYWVKEEVPNPDSCVLTLHRSDPLSTWRKMSCSTGNRWICETPALIRPH